MDRPDPTRSPDAIVRRLERALGRPHAAALAVQQAGDAEGAEARALWRAAAVILDRLLWPGRTPEEIAGDVAGLAPGELDEAFAAAARRRAFSAPPSRRPRRGSPRP